jgi:hypothetical protein
MTNVTTTPSLGANMARQFVTDFALALLVFAFFAGVFSVSSGHAFPAPPPSELVPAAAHAIAFVPTLAIIPPSLPTDPAQPWSLLPLLAMTTSALLAFNLAVLRHLRSAYASPRRRS